MSLIVYGILDFVQRLKHDPITIFYWFKQVILQVSTFTPLKSRNFVKNNLFATLKCSDRIGLFRHSISKVETDGLFLEFGVYKGESINQIASLVHNKTVYGFDSFKGLPEDWKNAYPKGKFELNKPLKVRSNVELVVGFFEETLEDFLNRQKANVAFIHLDADVYSSTKYVLFTLAKQGKLQHGTVIQFDEFFGYARWWTKGEYRAFKEFVEEFDVEFDYVGYTENKRVSVKILQLSAPDNV